MTFIPNHFNKFNSHEILEAVSKQKIMFHKFFEANKIKVDVYQVYMTNNSIKFC